jgi:hypothetical protein
MFYLGQHSPLFHTFLPFLCAWQFLSSDIRISLEPKQSSGATGRPAEDRPQCLTPRYARKLRGPIEDHSLHSMQGNGEPTLVPSSARPELWLATCWLFGVSRRNLSPRKRSVSSTVCRCLASADDALPNRLRSVSRKVGCPVVQSSSPTNLYHLIS